MELNTVKSHDVKCPVYVRFNKNRGHFVCCAERTSFDTLRRHMRQEHKIELDSTLRFYEQRADNSEWWQAHR